MSILSFVRGVFSESDGTPSSTRLLMATFSAFSSYIIFIIVRHLLTIKDPAILALWLTSFPGIVIVLVGLISTPYTVNKGASTLGDILSALSGKRHDGI